MITTADRAESLLDLLTSIRRDWPRPDIARDETRGRLGATVPISAAAMARMAIQQDIAFWVQAALSGPDKCLPDPEATIDLADVVGMCRYLLQHVRKLSGWEYVGRMERELAAHAHILHRLTHEPGVLLTRSCPVERMAPSGERAPCGAEVRAWPDRPSDVRCPGCATRDTIEGWQRRVVGDEPVTAEELAKRLVWLGRRVTGVTVRQWVSRGLIPHAVSSDEQGRALYDPARTMRALMAREHRTA